MAKQQDIVAERDGRRRNFHPKTWERFPDDKYGWREASDGPATPPPAVAAALRGRPKSVHQPKPQAPLGDVPRADDDVNSD